MLRSIVFCGVLSTSLASAVPAAAAVEPGSALRLGAIVDLTGPLSVHGPFTAQGIELAVAQVNAAGGVLGRPVELVVVDGATDAATAVARAHTLAARGVSGIVGPMGSAAAMVVGEEVSGPLGLPTISPSATAPSLRLAKDRDFLFRTALSDVAQGPVLAKLADDDGLERLSVLFQDDAYGRGLFAAFREAYDGELVRATAIAPEQSSYLAELRPAAFGSQGLVVIAYPGETDVILREALREGLFSTFLFVDANLGPDAVRAVGAAALEGLKGTQPVGPGAELSGTQTVTDELTAHFGIPPSAGAPFSAYDATVCLCLAAQAAGSTDPAAIRDALRDVCSGGDGRRFDAGAVGVAGALAALRQHQRIDFDGSSSTLDWDQAGDVATGYVGVFRYADGQLVLVERVPYGNRPALAASSATAGATSARGSGR